MCRKQCLMGVLGIVISGFSLAWGQGGMIGGGGRGDYEPTRQDYYAASWTSIGILSEQDNNNASSTLIEQEMHRALLIKGDIYVGDTTDLLGVSSDFETLEITDQNNHTLAIEPIVKIHDRLCYQACIPDANGMTQKSFELSCPLKTGVVYPTNLSEVEWQIRAVYADKWAEFQLPWQTTDDWTVLNQQTDGMIRLTETDAETYTYVLQIRFHGSDPTVIRTRRTSSYLPLNMIVKIDILDDQDRVIDQSFQSSTDITWNSDLTYTLTGTGPCSEGIVPTAIRIGLVQKLTEEIIPLSLNNLPLPTH